MLQLYVIFTFCVTLILFNSPSWGWLQDVNPDFIPKIQKEAAPENYQIIAKVYPRIKRIQPIEVGDHTYYVLLRNNKIKGIISIWVTAKEETTVLLVIGKTSQLKKIITMPTMNQIDLNEEHVMLNQLDENQQHSLSPVLTQLQQQLGQDWPAFIRKIKLTIHKSDAVTQATP